MSHQLDFDLPVHDPANGDDNGPHCGPTAYVSNEEATILAAMRELKREADTLRNSGPESEQPAAERRLAELRAEWSELAEKREQAFRRKMIMLGHLRPDEEVTLY